MRNHSAHPLFSDQIRHVLWKGQSAAAWRTYRRWIERGLLRCATRPRAERTGGARGFGVELAIDFSLLLLAATGRPYSPSLPDTELGVNIALGDVDQPARGDPDPCLGLAERHARQTDANVAVWHAVDDARRLKSRSAVEHVVGYNVQVYCMYRSTRLHAQL